MPRIRDGVAVQPVTLYIPAKIHRRVKSLAKDRRIPEHALYMELLESPLKAIEQGHDPIAAEPDAAA